MRVLLIKTSSLGDVIHTLPALTDAARALPGIRFDWVVEEGFAEIPAWHPAVERVIPVAIRRWRRSPWQATTRDEWRRFRQTLGEGRYDLVIDAQGLLKSAWLTRFGGAPVAGLDRRSAREPLASLLYGRRYPVPWGQHAVERVRQLFAQALGYPPPTAVGDYGLDRHRLAVPDGAPYLLFLHGTTWDSKHWPESYWRELAERMGSAGWAVRLPWGNAVERDRAGRIAEGLASVEVLPRINLAGIAGILAGASACVAVDTGLGHLAAALDVPTVSLYGPTDPRLTGAYGRHQRRLTSDYPACVPCLRKTCGYRPTEEDRRRLDLSREQPVCFSRIDPRRVAGALQALLDEAACRC
ncbi:lipopolysaccharide heptosyltransferase I, waaC [Azotobacter vinelandii CA]|uniref:Lipopolysaccharide heptosyltransferase 1 n=2 Tax=Azotobacter vinelandii TaxID=354 RepID=C1DGV6_AZOVD|nr:lipopolysaccharide heptosyltransferase I [Azotobacter vinelandii]ACO80602.1 lipopolysaccharide heptosyltransferase I, waaC [Azotobacter vinelandii DJ]AGK15926.1 lipopolysaccharide heptosyltransferase I, waaC [Azotobacter vinelandii CA]AGK22046.1 lipopolysaccharide heptosyltransferase I, waaC [Azotobacter vinelandii CA6]WKN21359.1 lipopolysaccharide heptosyltransferase I [Azotobacter vinelandii]SFX78722.1 heptosyltransferase-1 [Azotobacter vinelandii]